MMMLNSIAGYCSNIVCASDHAQPAQQQSSQGTPELVYLKTMTMKQNHMKQTILLF